MKKYLGHFTVTACPMTLEHYAGYAKKAHITLANLTVEERKQEGYLVVTPVPISNHFNYSNHIIWLPSEVFRAMFVVADDEMAQINAMSSCLHSIQTALEDPHPNLVQSPCFLPLLAQLNAVESLLVLFQQETQKTVLQPQIESPNK